MAGNSSSSSGTGETSGPPFQNLDLSTIEGHANSAEWIRSNVLLTEPEGEGIVQLNVTLRPDLEGKEQNVSLYMDTRNAYILAFRGGEGRLYLLNKTRDDQEAISFEQRLRKAGYAGKDEQISLSNLGADHKNALKTLEQRFRPEDLIYAGQINEFGDSDRMRTPEQLRRPISLLVCMLSESARMNLMEQQFRKLYFGEVAYPGEPGMVFTYEAKPDAAIQSYDKAIRISIWADKLVQHSDHWYRVELLDKRAAEMRDLVEAIVKAVDDGGQRKVMIQKILNGTLPPSSRDVDVKRLKAIADQLNIRDSGLLGEILATCKDKDAVRAAKAGVTLWRGV